jgi:aspartate 1-decarboxylase
MQIQILKSKIHRATITEANLNYVGSLTIDEHLMDAANLVEYEKIHVVNANNGERIETYVIKGKRGSGVICLNGPAARKGAEGDIVIIISYGLVEQWKAKTYQPTVIFPDANNKLPAHG